MLPDPNTESDDRVLCPDEMCTGVLDDEGVCGTCGTQGPRPAPRARADDAGAAAPRDGIEAPSGEEGGGFDPLEAALVGGEGSGGADGDAADPDERRPCVDGMCTGILGPDGRCGTCGRSGDA